MDRGGVGEYSDILSSGVFVYVFTDSCVEQSHGRSDQYFVYILVVYYESEYLT